MVTGGVSASPPYCHTITLKESTINRLITGTAVALLLSIAPAIAENSDQSDAVAKAMVPPAGSADRSSGAAQSTSTPPGSMSAQQDSSNPASKAATVPPSGSPDTSTGAAQSTSTPPKPGSSSPSEGQ